MKTLIILIALALVGWGIYAMVEKNPDMISDQSSETAAGGSDNGVLPNVDTSGSVNVSTGTVKEFVVKGANFSFSPSTMTVNKGDRVRIVFENSGGMHDWVIDEFSARTKVIQSGQIETIEFTADKSGTFEYYCSVGTHRQMGMKGTLTVK